MPSPERLVVVAGTGTEVGKTWWACAVASRLRARGVRVAARKLAQSFAAGDPPSSRDGARLAAATGEAPEDVCPPHRSYPLAMAPPMAADALGLPAFRVEELLAEQRWPPSVEVGLVETAGGVRSPLAADSDNVALCDALDPAFVVLVADAGLGTINLVRLSVAALARHQVVVAMNRYDDDDDLHRRNRHWLSRRDGLDVVVDVDALASRLAGDVRERGAGG